jgi:hypothetical protein
MLPTQAGELPKRVGIPVSETKLKIHVRDKVIHKLKMEPKGNLAPSHHAFFGVSTSEHQYTVGAGENFFSSPPEAASNVLSSIQRVCNSAKEPERNASKTTHLKSTISQTSVLCGFKLPRPKGTTTTCQRNAADCKNHQVKIDSVGPAQIHHVFFGIGTKEQQQKDLGEHESAPPDAEDLGDHKSALPDAVFNIPSSIEGVQEVRTPSLGLITNTLCGVKLKKRGTRGEIMRCERIAGYCTYHQFPEPLPQRTSTAFGTLTTHRIYRIYIYMIYKYKYIYIYRIWHSNYPSYIYPSYGTTRYFIPQLKILFLKKKNLTYS